MTWLRSSKLLWIPLTCAGLVVAAALMAPHLVKTSAARQAIADFLKTRLGREVEIGGALRFTLMPRVGFVMEDLRIAEAGGFEQGEAGRLAAVEVALAPLPLLRRHLVFESIRLQSPRLHIIRDKQGRINWDVLGVTPQHSDRWPKSAAGLLFEFRKLEISDGGLTLSDAISQCELRLSEIEFLRHGMQDRDFSFSALMVGHQPSIAWLDRIAARIRSTGRSRVSLAEGFLAVDAADLNVELRHNPPSGPPSTLAALSGELQADWPGARLQLKRLQVQTPGGRIQGGLAAAVEDGRMSLIGPFSLEIDDPKRFWTAVEAPPPALLERLPRQARIDFVLNADTRTVFFNRIQGHIDRFPIHGSAALEMGSPVQLTASLATEGIDLDAGLITGGPPPFSALKTGAGGLDWPIGVNLVLDADHLGWQGDRLSRPHLQIALQPGKGWHLETFTADWADAALSATGSLLVQGDEAEALMHLTARRADIGRIHSWGAAADLHGPMDIDLRLQSRGKDWEILARNAEVKVVVTTLEPLTFNDQGGLAIAGALEAEARGDGSFRMTAAVETSRPGLRANIAAEGIRHANRPILEDVRTQVDLVCSALEPLHQKVILDGRLSLDLENARMDYRIDQFSAFGLQGSGSIQWPTAGGPRGLKARLQIAPFDARPWLAVLGFGDVVNAGPDAWKRLGISTDLDMDAEHFALRDISLTLDETTIRGILDLTMAEPLQVHFMLDGDKLDLDRYRPTKDAPPSTGPEQPSRDIKKDWDIAGTLSLGRLNALGFEAQRVSMEIHSGNGRLHLDRFAGACYGGSLEASAMLALDGADPVWRLRTSLRGVDLHDPLARIFNTPVLSGMADIDAELFGRRRKDDPRPVAGLGGRIDWIARRGIIYGIRIVHDRNTAPPAAPLDAQPPQPPDQQPFEEIRGTWQITDGVAATQSHRLSADGLFMAAGGTVDLVQERLDAILAVDIEGVPTVYYSLAGPFREIRVDMDSGRLVLDSASRIAGSPLALGSGVLGTGADLLEQGRQAIGNGSGLQRMGQGAVGTGKGILKLGQGVLDIGQGPEKMGEGISDLGQGAADLGHGVLGLGSDVVHFLDQVGKGLQHLFGGGSSKTDPSSSAQQPPPASNGGRQP